MTSQDKLELAQEIIGMQKRIISFYEKHADCIQASFTCKCDFCENLWEYRDLDEETKALIEKLEGKEEES